MDEEETKEENNLGKNPGISPELIKRRREYIVGLKTQGFSGPTILQMVNEKAKTENWGEIQTSQLYRDIRAGLKMIQKDNFVDGKSYEEFTKSAVMERIMWLEGLLEDMMSSLLKDKQNRYKVSQGDALPKGEKLLTVFDKQLIWKTMLEYTNKVDKLKGIDTDNGKSVNLIFNQNNITKIENLYESASAKISSGDGSKIAAGIADIIQAAFGNDSPVPEPERLSVSGRVVEEPEKVENADG
jgi:hypothetical protein